MASHCPETTFKRLMKKIMEFDDQPKPVPNPLQAFNGRDSLKDAYEEALDLCVYLRTAIYEKDGK